MTGIATADQSQGSLRLDAEALSQEPPGIPAIDEHTLWQPRREILLLSLHKYEDVYLAALGPREYRTLRLLIQGLPLGRTRKEGKSRGTQILVAQWRRDRPISPQQARQYKRYLKAAFYEGNPLLQPFAEALEDFL